jgi:UDP-N-acetylmuramyl pentapeptide phosphotransferase/UDP-N-acetylglucosamine-1-phosphate transferase
MSFLVLAFLVSLLANVLVIRLVPQSGRPHDHPDPSRPQRFHSYPAPRVGGVGILVAVLAAAGTAELTNREEVRPLFWLLLCAMPAFLGGLVEDLWHNVSPRRRLFCTVLSALLALWLIDAVILRTDIPGLDLAIAWFPFAVALTLFVVTGVANSINIIDGFNGLASMCILIMTVAIAYVAFQVGDSFVLLGALITAGAVLGFFVWNFPAGLIFLGDGGAYLLGFVLAELSVMLLQRNPEVSPMFPLLLCVYPIFETVFTMYRRRVVRGVATAAPDGIHLHTLIHRRLIRWSLGDTQQRRQIARNSMTSPYLWILCLLSVVPSVLWWDNSAVLGVFIALFMISYVALYRSIVRFKTPKWLLFRR